MSKSHFATLIVPAAIILAGLLGCSSGVAGALASRQEDAHQTLRVVVDPARGRRWELGWGAVFAYDTSSGALIRRIRLSGASFSGARETCLPDMLLSRSGALIVSSNAQPTLWRIGPTRFELERFDIALDGDQDKDFGFSTLAWGADETVLLGTSAVMGTTWRIDLESATATRIAASPPVRGACR